MTEYGRKHTDGSRSGGQPVDTRRKAQAMLNDARDAHVNPDDYLVGYTALCRAIEQHEAFRQEVSDAVCEYKEDQPHIWKQSASGYLSHFIIPAPKPDPLVEALTKAGWGMPERNAKELRAALSAVGFEIREKNDD